MDLLFNPHKKTTDHADMEVIPDWKAVANRAAKFREEVVAARRARGCPAPESVPVYRRKTGEIRWFNFSLRYQGSLNHAESCLRSEWCLATDEEEAAAIAANDAAKLASAQQLVAADAAAKAKAYADNYQFQQAVKTVAAAEAPAPVKKK